MLTEEQKQAILSSAAQKKQVPAIDETGKLTFVFPPKGKKATRPKHWKAKKKAARLRSTASQAKNKVKKLSRRKKAKALHLRKRRNRK